MRRSIVFVAAMLLFAVVADAQSGKPVLTAADFEYVGVMRLPAEVTAFSWGSLAMRKVGGHLHFFVLGSRAQGDPLLEIDAPGFSTDLATSPRATLLQNWGTPYNKIGGGGDQWTEDLEWFNGLLYWTYGGSYPVTLVHERSIGVTDLTTPPTIYGPWRTEAHSHLTRGYTTTIPQWYADAYLGGKRLAVGSGKRSGISASSWGNVLVAIDPPTASTPVDQFLASTVLVEHPYTGSASYNYRQPRPANYIANGDPDLPPLDGIGYWTQVDHVETATWIDLPDKHGVLFSGLLGTGNIYYAAATDDCGTWTGPHTDGRAMRWWIYDPMAFVPVIQGQAEPWTLTPTSELSTLGPIDWNCVGGSTGTVFDPETRMLYITHPQADPTTGQYPYPVIYAFHIKGDDAPPPPPPPPPGDFALAVMPSTAAPGASVSVSWVNRTPASTRDWMAVYPSGAGNLPLPTNWRYASCTQTAGSSALASGSCAFTAPTTAGTYDARFFSDDSYTVVGMASLTVSAAPPPPPPPASWTCTVPAAVTTYANGDKKITVRCPPATAVVKNDTVTVAK